MKFKVGDKVRVCSNLVWTSTRVQYFPPLGFLDKIRSPFRYKDGDIHESNFYLKNWVIGFYREATLSEINGLEIPFVDTSIEKYDWSRR